MEKGRERQFKCTAPGCGHTVSTHIPEGNLINKPSFSMLVMVHDTAVICSNCGQAYSFVLRGLNLRAEDVAWAPVIVSKEESDIVIPPTSVIDLVNKKGN